MRIGHVRRWNGASQRERGRRESRGLRALDKVVNSRELVEVVVAVGVAFDVALRALASLARAELR
jgi:hypothetical protein